MKLPAGVLGGEGDYPLPLGNCRGGAKLHIYQPRSPTSYHRAYCGVVVDHAIEVSELPRRPRDRKYPVCALCRRVARDQMGGTE